MTNKSKDKETGYVMLIVVMFLALIGAVLSATLAQDAVFTKTVYAIGNSSKKIGSAEAGIGHAVAWLRQNSQKLAYPFHRDQFYSSFDRTAPSIGDNDTGTTKATTKIKLAGTNNSVILVNDAGLATSAFPSTLDLTTGVSFDAAIDFSNDVLGDAKLRVTLIDAVAEYPSKDYGAPPSPSPETDFYPIYRIDSLSDNGDGFRLYATVVGEAVNFFDVALYGQDSLSTLQSCDAYNSSAGSYGVGNQSADCSVISPSTVQIDEDKSIHGSVVSNANIDNSSPWGGAVCANFDMGCPAIGEKCEDPACSVGNMPRFYNWILYCTSDQGNLTISSDTTLSVASDSPSDKCWDQVTIAANTTLTLDTTEFPYFFKTIVFDDAATSKIQASPSPTTEPVTLYIESITGNTINGDQLNTTNDLPVDLQVYYLGSTDITIGGATAMHLAIASPNASVVTDGTFDFFGSLSAKSLSLQSTGNVHYDYALQNHGELFDMRFRTKNIVQYFN